MGETKDAKVTITVDLKSWYTSATIKWALCQLQMCFTVNSVVFDNEKNTVTVSGPFGAQDFIRKLCCMAGSVITNIDPPMEQPVQPPVVCPPFPGPMWRCCYKPCNEPQRGGCSSCSNVHYFPCPPARPQPYPCYKIVCEYDPCYGCSNM